MRRSLTTAALAMMVAIPATAQQHERDEMSHEGGAAALVGQFTDNQMALHELVSGLTTQQLSFRESEDRWSILEVIEHITLAQQATYAVLTGDLVEIEASEEGEATAAGFEQQVAESLADRSQTFDAPPEFVPTGSFSSGDEAIAAFDEGRGSMIYFLENADFDLRSRGAQHPIFGQVVDVSTWAVVDVNHAKRHMQQIQQVIDAEGFPG